MQKYFLWFQMSFGEFSQLCFLSMMWVSDNRSHPIDHIYTYDICTLTGITEISLTMVVSEKKKKKKKQQKINLKQGTNFYYRKPMERQYMQWGWGLCLYRRSYLFLPFAGNQCWGSTCDGGGVCVYRRSYLFLHSNENFLQDAPTIQQHQNLSMEIGPISCVFSCHVNR